jgi:hypothetical protein
VVYGSDNVEFEFTVRGGLEDACIDLDLFDTGAIEFFECCNNARLLSCAGRAIYEEMWEVAALCLHNDALVAVFDRGCGWIPYKGSKTIRKLRMVAERLKTARSVFIY